MLAHTDVLMTELANPLARELDGRLVSERDVVRVTGVHEDGGAQWVQITLGSDERDLILHVPDGATAADAVNALESCLRGRADVPQVIKVGAPGQSA